MEKKTAKAKVHPAQTERSGGQPPVVQFTLTKVVRESFEHQLGEDGLSFGQMLDAHLREAALSFQTVQEVKFEIVEPIWDELATHMRHEQDLLDAQNRRATDWGN